VIRLVIPELTEERRKDLSKQVHKSAEEAKVAIRSIRRDAMEHLKKLQKDSKITEDELAKAEKKMQETTDDAIKGVTSWPPRKKRKSWRCNRRTGLPPTRLRVAVPGALETPRTTLPGPGASRRAGSPG
jgi:hypothetical protein